MRRRAESQGETRRRIVEAALQLHRMLGPARTPLSAVAAAAGVQRHTLYRHFPTPESLFKACGEHFAATSGRPDPARWSELPATRERARVILADLYAWYAGNADAVGRALRDSDQVPVGSGVHNLQAAAVDLLAGRAQRRRAAARMMVSFGAWSALTEDGAMAPAAAAKLAAEMLEAATPSRHR